MPTGSSPLTRGKRRVHRQAEALHRLIPAHAGKTMRARSPAARFRAHPRSRGENSVGDFCGCGGEGSSPLTRGKQSAFSSVCLLLGLIPAHAGKTPNHPLCPVSHQAHPRSRGENYCAAAVSEAHAGSSPLTRGKHDEVDGLGDHGRLIPAHAGKTRPASGTGRSGAAHPRSRGENTAYMRDGHPEMGSSPLTRGKPCRIPQAAPSAGLIPAHAGKTGPCGDGAHDGWAHPRSRGENALDVDPAEVDDGSSPLTRGKPSDRSSAWRRMGLIPAHAGKTATRRAGCRSAPAHPRSRGENLR